MHRAFKAKYWHASKGALKVLATATFSQAAAKAAFYLALLILGTRKRVDKLLHANLFRHRIFLQLVPDIFCYPFLIPSYCVDVVSSAPEMSVPILVLHIRMTVEDHQRAFSFQISDKLRYA